MHIFGVYGSDAGQPAPSLYTKGIPPLCDIGCSEHFLVWMEIGRVTKRGKKVKRVLKGWRLVRFDYVKVRVTYQKAIQPEVLGNFSQKVESGMKGELLVQEVVHEWEDIVNRVAKSVV